MSRNTHLTVEMKEAIVQKALSRGSKSIQEIADENGVGYSTLSKWIRQVKDGNGLSRSGADDSGIAPLEHLLATHGMSEEEVGIYCRSQGIFSHQLENWKRELMSYKEGRKPTNVTEVKALKREVKELERELNRKEKALAETAALLTLKKKADLIWGESGGVK